MPIYNFKCKCGKLQQKLVPAGTKNLLCECGLTMKRTLHQVEPPTMMERMDSHRNKHQRQNFKERATKRAKEFFLENELTEKTAIAGTDDSKRKGWIEGNKIVKKFDRK